MRATASKLLYNIDASRPNNTINPIMYAEELARPCILLQRHYISAVYAAEASIFGLLNSLDVHKLAVSSQRTNIKLCVVFRFWNEDTDSSFDSGDRDSSQR